MYNIYKMATVSSYTFDNMSRIGLDECCKSQGDLQNVNSANYMLQNYHISDCSMKNTINLATTQPGIMYNGGFNSNFCGTNIDTNSKLLIGTIQTHPRCHIDLFQRPFATVPFLGRGSVNPIIESQIQQGDTSVNKRSVNNLSEKSYIKYSHTPLLSSVYNKVNNPANYVEGVASKGWVRGGVPSRELTRDKDYHN
jgi:hypothetical protein